jgi:UPF0755 protein
VSRRRASGALVLLLAACGAPSRDAPARIVVPAGASFGEVAESLAAHRVIANAFVFKLQARFSGADRKVAAGVYEFEPGMSADAVLERLAGGRVVADRFTVPEGLTMHEIAALAESRLGIPADSVLAAAGDRALIDSLGLDAPSLEGYLWPDTYHLDPDATAGELVRTLVGEFLDSWRPEWSSRLDSLGMTRHQLLTMASIVEGEARVDSERETIAGVYFNRLRRGMPLQADPTVQYAITLRTGRRKPRLYEKDYLTPSPYNTYQSRGLPPGPVASPGRRSIEAALRPADVPFLYFVASPDGSHTFTRTYAEHLRAVARARRARDAAARSTDRTPPGGN